MPSRASWDSFKYDSLSDTSSYQHYSEDYEGALAQLEEASKIRPADPTVAKLTKQARAQVVMLHYRSLIVHAAGE